MIFVKITLKSAFLEIFQKPPGGLLIAARRHMPV